MPYECGDVIKWHLTHLKQCPCCTCCTYLKSLWHLRHSINLYLLNKLMCFLINFEGSLRTNAMHNYEPAGHSRYTHCIHTVQWVDIRVILYSWSLVDDSSTLQGEFLKNFLWYASGYKARFWVALRGRWGHWEIGPVAIHWRINNCYLIASITGTCASRCHLWMNLTTWTW